MMIETPCALTSNSSSSTSSTSPDDSPAIASSRIRRLGRVAIARAVINHPALVLADEPTGNLDSENSEIVLNMLRDLNRQFGQTIIMITHNPEAAAYSKRVIEMRDGRILHSKELVGTH